jgi:hypothetical protein
MWQKTTATDGWKSMIPSIMKDAVFWLDSNETIHSLINLPSYKDERHEYLLAVGTISCLMLMPRTILNNMAAGNDDESRTNW